MILKQRKLIGMVIPDGQNQFFSGLVQQFQRELSTNEYSVISMDSFGSHSREVSNIKLFKQLDIIGLVFVSVGDSAEANTELSNFGPPLLVLDREVPFENADFVLTDNSSGVKMAIEFLYSLGHKKIGCIKGPKKTAPGVERFSCFIESCDELKIDSKKFVFEGDFRFFSGVSAAEKLLRVEKAEWPSAVFASNDLMAIGFMQKLQESGFNIPNDISVVGYDDIPLSSWVYPKLTTIHQDVQEIARTGVRFLIDRIEGASEFGKHKIRTASVQQVASIQPKLVKRSSHKDFN